MGGNLRKKEDETRHLSPLSIGSNSAKFIWVSYICRVEVEINLLFYYLFHLASTIFVCAKHCDRIMCKINVQGRNTIQWRIQTIQGNCSVKRNMFCNNNTWRMLGDESTLFILRMGEGLERLMPEIYHQSQTPNSHK